MKAKELAEKLLEHPDYIVTANFSTGMCYPDDYQLREIKESDIYVYNESIKEISIGE